MNLSKQTKTGFKEYDFYYSSTRNPLKITLTYIFLCSTSSDSFQMRLCMKIAYGVNLHWQRNKFKFQPSIIKYMRIFFTASSLACDPVNFHLPYIESFCSKPQNSPSLRHSSVYINKSKHDQPKPA